MKVYIITGIYGFIGSNLAEYLLDSDPDCVVYGIDKTHRFHNEIFGNLRCHYFIGDITNHNDIHKFFSGIIGKHNKIDCVFHLAALSDVLPSIQEPQKYFNANVNGTQKVLEMMRTFGVKNIIYSASSSCYGDTTLLPTKENLCLEDDYEGIFNVDMGSFVYQHLAPYATTKWMGERLCEMYAKFYDINCISLRYFNVYGKRVKTEGEFAIPIGIWLAQYFNDKPVTYIGEGQSARDYVDVRDVVRINAYMANYLSLSDRTTHHFNEFNVGTGVATKIYDIIGYICDHKNTRQIQPRKNEANITQANITKLRYFMNSNWQEMISVKDGITWLKENEEKYFKNAKFPTYETSETWKK